jgi:hypothetical protein
LIYKTAADTFLLLKKYLSKRRLRKKYTRKEPPLRSELLSSEQMKQHGKKLAGLHQLTNKKATEKLLERPLSKRTALLLRRGNGCWIIFI